MKRRLPLADSVRRNLARFVAPGLLALGLAVGAVAATVPPVTPARPGETADRLVEYVIDAKLDPATHTITAHETIRWRNPSTDPIPELRFHLYLNAFKNNRSSFLQESGGFFRWDQKDDDGGWGSVDVTRLSGPGGVDLKKGARFESPDDDNPADETVWVVPLPQPVPPGGSIELEAEFTALLPKIVARAGWSGEFHLAGQWFPKLGLYEPAGMRGRMRGGWNCHQYHANSEFYADYGRFDVTLHYPDRFVVAAVGECRATHDAGRERTTRYVAEDVHDFAFVAWPRFHVIHDRFDPAKDVPKEWIAEAKRTLGLTDAELALKPVDITYLEVPGREPSRARQLAALKGGLAWMGLHYGAYPYRTLTLVDVPRGAEEAGGMEYPTFITALVGGGFAGWVPSGERFSVDTAVHEFGHQYFYGMVGSNEFEEPWLDEGLNSYATARTMEALYGDTAGGKFLSVHIPAEAGARIAYVSNPGADPLERFAWDFSTTDSYYTKSYSKTDMVMRSLRKSIGPERFDRALRAYATRWRFRHPSAADLRVVLEEYAGRSLEKEWASLVTGTDTVDYKVDRFRLEADEDEGMFDRPGGRVTVPDPKMSSKGDSKKKDDASKAKTWSTVVIVRNEGTLALPVTIRFVFKSGDREQVSDRRWDGTGGWVRYRVAAKWKLDRVEIDPDGEIPMDLDRTNNSRTRVSNLTAAAKIGQWVFAFAGSLLSRLGGALL